MIAPGVDRVVQKLTIVTGATVFQKILVAASREKQRSETNHRKIDK